MKSDLTCPVEIVRVTIQRETEDTNENGQILCLIDFFNLSDKVIDSIQMNIICFDAEDQRLGGRLVRAGAHGEPRENFSGAFAPEHVENVARVEAAVEKVWYQDGVMGATNGLMDGKMLAGTALSVLAIREWRLAGLAVPGAMTLLWWAARLFGGDRL